MTGIRVANVSTTDTNVVMWQYGFSSSGATCSTSGSNGSRFLGEFAVPAGQTVEEPLTTPLILKPLSTGGGWCLITFASGNTGQAFYITYNGYTVSGAFTTAATAAPTPGGTLAPAPRKR